MSANRWLERIEQRLFTLLVYAYPREFRGQYGGEMRRDFAQLCGTAAASGAGARLSLWHVLLRDTLVSAPRERWHAWRERARALRQDVPRPDYAGALLALLAVFLLYWLTLAPTAAFWDAGEYITVGSVLGIPHPPGNPMFVVLARVWDVLLSPTGWSTAVRINLLSAWMSATAHALLFLLLERSLRAHWELRVRRVAAACGVLLSATAFTVWHQSNVNEKVYTVSFFTVLLATWLVLRWRDTRRPALLLLAFYLTALTMANHLMGVLVAPGLLLFVLFVDARVFRDRRLLAAALPALLLALSAHLFLPLRAAQQPLVNEADPGCDSLGSAALTTLTFGGAACDRPGANCNRLQQVASGLLGERGCPALAQMLRREQYQKPSMWRDPTQPELRRGGALLAAQFLNYLQYFDWQWARSLAPRNTLFGWPRPLLTLGVILLIVLGAHTQWRADRAASLLHGTLLLVFSAGLVWYLNFKWGFTINTAALPASDLHEVRERDYFFLIGFSLWGAWAGIGLTALWQRMAAVLPRVRRAELLAAPVLSLALLPLALNWTWASRADDWSARDWAFNVLMSVEPYGVLITNGDNDSFPLWYLQHVERVREDVTIVLGPYVGTAWYARQIRDLSRPCGASLDPAANPTRITCQRPFRPEQVHPRLLAAWQPLTARPPEDSILPLNDAEIERLADTFFLAEQPIAYRAGSLDATIAAGTVISPADTFVAAIVRHTYGERPIHFMSSAPVVSRLGLADHTVRVGLTWRLRQPNERAAVVSVPDPAARPAAGAMIDLMTTDTLADHVFMVRGRLLDPERAWVDHASFSIPVQYALMHYAAAHTHEVAGNRPAAQWHAERLEFWNRLLSD